MATALQFPAPSVTQFPCLLSIHVDEPELMVHNGVDITRVAGRSEQHRLTAMQRHSASPPSRLVCLVAGPGRRLPTARSLEPMRCQYSI